ncbi:GNAT family N-acetyltransferase [Haloarchaeobius sp. TZWWS8]|uniref:GNAT family N-acetyltransferase n=1 Tax=Haloarchaeobius sp. TZWWS8 TaxID=3446121 RepID=UPI003EBD0E43
MTEHAFLTDGRVSLRPVESSDLPSLRAAWNDPTVWQMLDTVEPQSEADFRELYESWRADDGFVPFAIDADGLVGCCQVKGIHWQSGICRLSYFVLPARQGEGYASAAVRLALEYAFDHLRLHRVEAATVGGNEASQAVLEKAGFTHEGTARNKAFVDGDYHDLLSWGILAAEWVEEQDPSEPDESGRGGRLA